MSSMKRLIPLNAVVLDANPPSPRIGDIYFNSISSQLRFYNGTEWQDMGGMVSGILDHVHTYDGEVFSVESNQIPSPRIIDGGTP